MIDTLRRMLAKGLVSAGLVLTGGGAAHAATATWCLKDDLLREIVRETETEGSCFVDYNKPLEDRRLRRLWSSRHNAEFCTEKFRYLADKLTQSGWRCSPDFYVHNGRFDRTDAMVGALEQVQAHVTAIGTNLAKFSTLKQDISFAISVGLYQGRFRDLGAAVSGDARTGYFDVEQDSGQASYLFWTEIHCENETDGTPVYCYYLGFDLGGDAPKIPEGPSVPQCPAADQVARGSDIFHIGSSRAVDHVVSISKEGLVFWDRDGRRHAVIWAERFGEGYRMVCAPSFP